MKTLITVLTYRRVAALQETLRGLSQHCAQYPVAVFEDLGNRDGTVDFLTHGRKGKARPELLAVEHAPSAEFHDAALPGPFHGAQPWRAFCGTHNLGVAGNSNRALKYFIDSDADHLCLLNDDLHVDGDFAAYYAKAHKDLGVGMFCYCPMLGESYRWVPVRSRGHGVKILPRLTGIMISITRKLVEQIGYFDTRFGKFGEEHVDYSHRARFAGFVKLEDQDQNGLDIEHGLLRHQEVATSVSGAARHHADRRAETVMQHVSKEYRYRHYYRPFCLQMPEVSGSHSGGGIPVQNMAGYELVSDLV